MGIMLSRREGVAAIVSALAFGPNAASAAAGRGEPFSWDLLKGEAMRLASQPWRTLPPAPGAQAIDFEEVGRIAYRADKALWRGEGDAETRFFPVHRFADTPVRIAIVEGGMARPFAFTPDLFAVAKGAAGTRSALAPGLSGFRFMDKGATSDWLAFQGASYFRSSGALDQYGLSARGLAIDTGIAGAEEFPLFTRFWIERRNDGAVIVYALMEGRSVAGAYRFVNRRTPAGVVQDVSMAIQLRADVARLGIAPLTSMFWYGEGNRAAAVDWRPEIHDSDGLALLTGTGERIWRPLVNPGDPQISSFIDRGPRGFGLLQRDRAFDHYQDDGAFYEKRPSLWVEPRGDWGAGQVMLYEIPTRREIEDNVVAFWTPAKAARAGDRYAMEYRLSWIGGEPMAGPLARVADCWTGTAGPPGRDPLAGARRLVADFEGPVLAGLGRDSGVAPIVSISSGDLIAAHAYPVVGRPSCWRLIADVAPRGTGHADVRAYLKRGAGALSETLLYRIG